MDHLQALGIRTLVLDVTNRDAIRRVKSIRPMDYYHNGSILRTEVLLIKDHNVDVREAMSIVLSPCNFWLVFEYRQGEKLVHRFGTRNSLWHVASRRPRDGAFYHL